MSTIASPASVTGHILHLNIGIIQQIPSEVGVLTTTNNPQGGLGSLDSPPSVQTMRQSWALHYCQVLPSSSSLDIPSHRYHWYNHSPYWVACRVESSIASCSGQHRSAECETVHKR